MSELLSREFSGGNLNRKVRAYDYDSAGARLGQDRFDVVSGSETEGAWRGYATDANGSVEGLEEPDGSVAAGRSYSYDPYGKLETAQYASPLPPDLSVRDENPFRFEGFYEDHGLGIYDMFARTYRPGGGHFLSADRFEDPLADVGLRADPRTSNRFAFASGDPVDDVEADGHKSSGNHDQSEPHTNQSGGTSGRQNRQAARRFNDHRRVVKTKTDISGAFEEIDQRVAAAHQAAEKVIREQRDGPLDLLRDTVGGLVQTVSDPALIHDRTLRQMDGFDPLGDLERDARAAVEGVVELCRDSGPGYCGPHVFITAVGLRGAGAAARAPTKTSGVLDVDGESIRLTSGTGAKEFSHYPAYNHVKGQAAILMRQRGATHADLIMDNPSGICPLCNSNLPSLLPEGAILRVYAPAGTVPKRGWQNSRTFIGNSTDPLAGR